MHNKELHICSSSSPNIIIVIKATSMSWVRLVGGLETRMNIRF